MASGLFLLLDDIAVLADDVAIATKIATKKTAAILGDDIAVSAQKATGFDQDRELKIIWAIIKGSLTNKLIILPLAFILSVFMPSLISYILIFGAFYLLFEGVEKIEEYLHHKLSKNHDTASGEIRQATGDNVLEIEKMKIKSAIFTDFILSIEIVIIALSSVMDKTLEMQIVAVSAVALLATFGVYGLVALIVRIDNVGFWLISKKYTKSGTFLIALMPKIITLLTVVGTMAMVLVGGGILLHNIDFLHHTFETTMINALWIGLLGGVLILSLVKTVSKIRMIRNKQVS